MAKSFLDYDGLSFFTSLFKNLINKKVVDNGVTTAGTGAAYTATVDGITALTAGVSFMMVPHVASTNVLPTLNVNGLGAKAIRRRVSNSTVTTVASASESWLGKNKPVRVTYDGTYWIADLDRPNANDIYGTVDIPNGGTGATTLKGIRTNLGIVTTVHNLLDNSYFRNPVNQTDEETYTANGYTIDRWKLYGGQLSIEPGEYVSIKGSMYQLVPGIDFDKKYTFAAENGSGIVCVSGYFRDEATASLGNLRIQMLIGNQTGGGDDIAEVVLENADGYDLSEVYWAALYEGEYTEETLPKYQNKDYGAELVECRRYSRPDEFYMLPCYSNSYLTGFRFDEMRIVPTITMLSVLDIAGNTIANNTSARLVAKTGLSHIENTNFAKGNYYKIHAKFDANL